METWEIIITILVIINVVAFASAIYEASTKWKKGEKEWEIPLIGLFIIPVFIILALLSPYYFYKKNREKFLEEQRREEMKKKREESKKYHFRRFAFRVKNLPFNPISQEVIYVENEYNERINQIIKRNLDYIQKCLDESRYFQSRFIYLPSLLEELSVEETVIGYVAPYLKEKNVSPSNSLKSSSLLDYMAAPEHRVNITPCFARYRGEDSDCSLFECVGFEPEEGIDEKDFLKLLCSAFDYYPRPIGPAYQTVEKKEEDIEKTDADTRFEESSKLLMKEIEERIIKLRKMGISQWALEQLVKPEMKLSRLVITKDYRILLPDYNDMEIKMEPLVKAVYLLFLKHPEGIYFKHLPDYREELMQIYVKLKPNGMNDRVLQSIEDVTNPLLNSINEKCARIRGAFVGQFDNHMARHYYIDGSRGEVKKIALPRDLVIWE